MAGNPPRPDESNLRRITQAVRECFEGRSNAVGSVTLATGSATTTVVAINCGIDSKPFLMPATASAATELGAGGLYVSSVGNGYFVVTHANSAVADRTFYWVTLG